MKATKIKQIRRDRRHRRIRTHLSGTAEKPRLAVFKSLKHFYCQIIDDERGLTLASSSTLVKSVSDKLAVKKVNKTESAKVVGEDIAERAVKAGIKTVVFDRGGFKYHGRVKAMADAARKAGLKF